MRTMIIFLLCPLLLLFGCGGGTGNEAERIGADPGKGFHFPYFLYLPPELPEDKLLTLVVEPNNTGFVSDDLDEHLDKARRQATNDFYLGNYVATELNLPLLVPAFPRPEQEWHIYTHSLDRDAALQKGNALERIDLQLIAMINDARDRLMEKGFHIDDRVFLTGFSASGTFVNRFSAIHPRRVKACAAGGLNGLLILPLDELQGERLEYPVGTADFTRLFGKEFEEDAFRELPQFLFMGELDDNDAIAYDDGYSLSERETIHTLLGRQMQPLRWESCRKVYSDQGINATIKVYKDLGHEHPEAVKKEIRDFFRANL